MNISFDADDLEPVIKATVSVVLEQLEADRAKFNGKLAFPEAEAASLLGIAPHVLRDCRRRGELIGSKAGAKIVYEKTELLRFLERNRL